MGHWRRPTTGKQRHPRVAAAVPVRISTVDPEIDPDTGRRFFRSAEETTANLSRGGAYLRSWEPLEAGRRVILTIDPAGDALQLTARVVWTRRQLQRAEREGLEAPGYGLEFVECSQRELAQLDRWLRSDPAVDRSRRAPEPPTTPPGA
jgi:hypothetical protein